MKKVKRCKVCRSEFMPFNTLQKVCGVTCALQEGKRTAKSKEDKAARKAVLELRKRDIRWQHKRTQIAFNKKRVLEELKWFSDRDLEPVCISCQKPLGGDQWCCGHFKTVGSNGRLRYDDKNTYLQHNRNCNMSKSGDIKNYEIGLISRFGEKKGREIIAYCEENNSPIKYQWEELELMRSEFNKKIRELT